jgi:hypothetical protein
MVAESDDEETIATDCRSWNDLFSYQFYHSRVQHWTDPEIISIRLVARIDRDTGCRDSGRVDRISSRAINWALESARD